MSKPKHPRYKVEGSHIFQHSVLHKTTGNFFVVPDEIALYASSNSEVTKLRIGSAHESVYYEADIDSLIAQIEDEVFELQIRDGDGQEGFLVPTNSAIFTKLGVSERNNDNAWERQKREIIEASGGFWSYSKRQSWANKFRASVNPKNPPMTGWYARGL
jgi:hypothetical protein